MSQEQNFWPGWVIFLLLWSGQPPLGLENFSLKIPNFSIFFPSDKKILSDQSNQK